VKQNEYIQIKTAKGIVWKLKEKGDFDDVQTIEDDARGSDVVLMVVYLATVVCLISVVCGALLAGILRTIVLKANPAIDPDWLGGEIVFVFKMTLAMITLAQFALIFVHAKIGTLIANH